MGNVVNTIWKVGKLLCAFSMWCTTSNLEAQDLEYKYEVGGMLGGSFYLGDANTNRLYKNTNFGGGAFLRYNINPRMSLKFDLAAGGISGDATKGENYIPDASDMTLVFDNTVWDVGCQYEISFWGYGTGRGYKGTKRLVPYLQLGMGFTYCNNLSMNIPLGLGVKYKIAERWNVGIDWSMRFAFSDKLDGIVDPYRINSGFLKNKDTYCWTMFYVSYDICPKLRKCNND